MSCNYISLTVVTSLTFELPYFTHINIGRKGHEWGLWILCIVMLEESGLSFPTLFPRDLSLVLQSLEAEFFGEEK